MRVGIDTGGTFTDVVVDDGRRLRTFKVPSTPADPARAILEALGRLDSGQEAGFELVHGSTVATNAVLEGTTAPTALLITAGFEDLLEIGRQARPSLYDIEVQRPRSLVPEELRFGISERTLASGRIERPVDLEAVRKAGREAAGLGARSVAVCFLHAYRNPSNEEEAARVLGEIFPGHVTLSSAILREFREFERCSTTVVNAGVAPVMGAYLRRLEEEAAAASLRIMTSNGGSASSSRASREAVTTILSGPAAGVVASRRIGVRIGEEQVISFDMGGTSTDVSLIPGRIQLTGATQVAGHPLRTPAIDIHTVGAGGGSIAWIDAGGALKVGPQSAGAEPGPACYGRGGPVTVTDANLVLGRLRSDRFLDGEMALDLEASLEGMKRLAGQLGISPEEAAAGIVEVADVTMARAIREVSLFRGHDPSGFVLCAYGGAGGLHAASLARAAGTRGALVPPEPGVFSAWGLLTGERIIGRSETILRTSEEMPGGIGELLAPLEEDARRAMAVDVGGEPARAAVVERLVDARYLGQSHEITVEAGGDWKASFHEAHRARFGFGDPAEPVVAVTLRVRARLPVEPPAFPGARSGSRDPGGEERVEIWDDGDWKEGRVLPRASLEDGARIAGPAVVTEPGATTYVPSGQEATVIEQGCLRIAVTS